MVLRAKKMALFDFDVTTCKTTQKWQKEGHFSLWPQITVGFYNPPIFF
jgi:hypothetical protein